MGSEGRLVALREAVLGGAHVRSGRCTPRPNATDRSCDGQGWSPFGGSRPPCATVPGVAIRRHRGRFGARSSTRPWSGGRFGTPNDLMAADHQLSAAEPGSLDLLRGGDHGAVELVVNEARGLTGSCSSLAHLAAPPPARPVDPKAVTHHAATPDVTAGPAASPTERSRSARGSGSADEREQFARRARRVVVDDTSAATRAPTATCRFDRPRSRLLRRSRETSNSNRAVPLSSAAAITASRGCAETIGSRLSACSQLLVEPGRFFWR